MSKFSINHISGKSYFISGIFSIGAYIKNKNVTLIDSGSDERYAKNIYTMLVENGYTVRNIINTHWHPDHSGGNHFFQKKIPDLKIYCAHDEKEFIENPDFAPRCFCSGAAAFAGLKNKHIAPQKPSKVSNIITPYSDHVMTIDDEEFKIVTLPGHTPGSIGIITTDNILYSGDALFGQDTFAKHPILFYTDIQKTLNSLQKLRTLEVAGCLLYHGGFIKNLSGIIQQHESKILETQHEILSVIKKQPSTVDHLTQKIMLLYKIPENIVAFTLTQTTIRAYLTHLESEKMIELIIKNGSLQAVAI